MEIFDNNGNRIIREMKMKIYVNTSKMAESLGLPDIIENHWIDLDTTDASRGFSKGDVPWNKGIRGQYKHSDETKQKLRDINAGKKLTEEHKRRIGAANSISKKGCAANNKGKQLSYNQRSSINKKTSAVIDPSGKKIQITNMSLFCDENGLSKSIMCLLVNGKRVNYKGYTAAMTEDHLGIK
jgi:hypothetical protein